MISVGATVMLRGYCPLWPRLVKQDDWRYYMGAPALPATDAGCLLILAIVRFPQFETLPYDVTDAVLVYVSTLARVAWTFRSNLVDKHLGNGLVL